MSFVKRKIILTFQLGLGTFGESGTNTVTVSGLRVRARIHKTGGDSMGEAQVRVSGLTKSLLNELSGLNQNMMQRKNGLLIQAGDDQSGMAVVFQGQIILSQIDGSQPPEMALNVLANVGALQAIQPASSTSYPGSADVATILSGLATRMGMQFQNDGVTGMRLSTPYFPGTLRDQALACVRAAGIEWNGLDGGVLEIWPRGKSRGGLIPVISPSTGMVGYPSYSETGIAVRTEFNFSLNFGQKVKVQGSIIEVANGEWIIHDIWHSLETELPNGAWFTDIQAFPQFAAFALPGQSQ